MQQSCEFQDAKHNNFHEYYNDYRYSWHSRRKRNWCWKSGQAIHQNWSSNPSSKMIVWSQTGDLHFRFDILGGVRFAPICFKWNLVGFPWKSEPPQQAKNEKPENLIPPILKHNEKFKKTAKKRIKNLSVFLLRVDKELQPYFFLLRKEDWREELCQPHISRLSVGEGEDSTCSWWTIRRVTIWVFPQNRGTPKRMVYNKQPY